MGCNNGFKKKKDMFDNDGLQITTAMEQESAGQNSYIKVIGVGGAGTNAVNHMYRRGITGVDFIVCNTDQQSLDASPVPVKIKLGNNDLGAGNNPKKGEEAAIASAESVKSVLSTNTRMLFIAAGMGGGTGTGASPVIASIAKDIKINRNGDEQSEEQDEILVVAVVTIPFAMEGRKRREQAASGIEKLKEVVDSIIVINTDKLKSRGNIAMSKAFALADDVLLTAAKGIAEMMTANAYIHVDFCDVQSVMQHSGVALMGTGMGEGEHRAYEAIKAATTSELLNNDDLSQTKNILLYISFSSKEEYEMGMEEFDTITNFIDELTTQDVDKIYGYGYDDSLEGRIAITIVATGFESKELYKGIERTSGIGNASKKGNGITIEMLEYKKESENTIQEQSHIKEEEIIGAFPLNTKPTTDKSFLIDDGFVLHNINEEQSPSNVMTKEEREVITLELGMDEGKKQDIEQPKHSKENAEDRQGILEAFARTEDKTQTINVPNEEESTTFAKTSMSSLFAPSNNEAINQLFGKKEEQSNIAPSLNDIVNSQNEQKSNSQAMHFPITNENRENRIKRIHDLLKEGRIDIVQGLRPNIENIDEKPSLDNAPQTRMGITDDGTVTILENPVIGSGVD